MEIFCENIEIVQMILCNTESLLFVFFAKGQKNVTIDKFLKLLTDNETAENICRKNLQLLQKELFSSALFFLCAIIFWGILQQHKNI